MRILKFKAWDKTHSEWYMDGTTFDLNYSARYGDFYFDNDNPHNMRDVKLEWVQYTGLKDKHGKEIYEGDWVSLWVEENFYKGIVEGEVEWHDSTAQFMVMFPGDGVSIPIGSFDLRYAEIEIISNIYENPELLKD